nr:hypothetical protein GCM10020092_043400 [Actinoplanes digitatis]
MHRRARPGLERLRAAGADDPLAQPGGPVVGPGDQRAERRAVAVHRHEPVQERAEADGDDPVVPPVRLRGGRDQGLDRRVAQLDGVELGLARPGHGEG